MQLRYDNSVKNRIITVELETTHFTQKEVNALEKFGEPLIAIEKVYRQSFPVKVEKRIRTGFKIKVKFDGTEDMQEAVEAANAFIEDVTELLTESMSELIDQLDELGSEFQAKKGLIDIKY